MLGANVALIARRKDPTPDQWRARGAPGKAILQECADDAGLTLADICGRSVRVKNVTHHAAYRMRVDLRMGWPSIAAVLGFHHPSTAWYGAHRWAEKFDLPVDALTADRQTRSGKGIRLH